MYYTYVLQSEKDGSYYIGYTRQLQKRIRQHNAGKSTYTAFGIIDKIREFYEG